MATQLTELRGKATADLNRLLADKRRDLRALKAKALAHDLKGVRRVRALRREVARLLTIITEQRKVTTR